MSNYANAVTSRYGLVAGVLICVSVLLAAVVPFLNNPFSKQEYYGRTLYRKAPSFQLKDSGNNSIGLRDFQNKFVYLVFGYLGFEKVCHTQALTF